MLAPSSSPMPSVREFRKVVKLLLSPEKEARRVMFAKNVSSNFFSESTREPRTTPVSALIPSNARKNLLSPLSSCSVVSRLFSLVRIVKKSSSKRLRVPTSDPSLAPVPSSIPSNDLKKDARPLEPSNVYVESRSSVLKNDTSNPRSVSAMDARPDPASGEISLNLRKKSAIPSAPPPLKSYNESRSSLLKNDTSNPRSVSARDFSFVPAAGSTSLNDSKNLLSLLPP